MSYCTVEDVKSAVSFPTAGSPVSDADIQSFIEDSEEEIENIYKTKFGNVEDLGTATSATATTITDTGKPWETDQYVGYIAWVYGGTGSGQYREITTNTADTLTVSPAFDTTPDNTSTYRILKLGYKSVSVDGSGTEVQFVQYQPLVSLNSLTIDSTSVTPSNVYQYTDSGKLVLSTSAEATHFNNAYPQLIDINYVYGVYPMPRIIKRLCIVIAAMRALSAQIAGTYNDFTSFSLPGGVTAAKGEPYVNIQSALNKLQSEAKGIVYGDPSNALGADFRNLPSYRPFTLFG